MCGKGLYAPCHSSGETEAQGVCPGAYWLSDELDRQLFELRVERMNPQVTQGVIRK